MSTVNRIATLIAALNLALESKQPAGWITLARMQLVSSKETCFATVGLSEAIEIAKTLPNLLENVQARNLYNCLAGALLKIAVDDKKLCLSVVIDALVPIISAAITGQYDFNFIRRVTSTAVDIYFVAEMSLRLCTEDERNFVVEHILQMATPQDAEKEADIAEA